MGVTASGLRYPEPSEPVAQGAANIKALAEDLTGTIRQSPLTGRDRRLPGMADCSRRDTS